MNAHTRFKSWVAAVGGVTEAARKLQCSRTWVYKLQAGSRPGRELGNRIATAIGIPSEAWDKKRAA